MCFKIIKMKSINKTLLFVVALSLLTGCKKFLNVVPIDNQSGNNYWLTKGDVEKFTNGVYNTFRAKTCLSGSFFSTFDLRAGGIAGSPAFIGQLATNNIKTLMASSSWTSGYVFRNIAVWDEFYDVVQTANILYAQVDQVPDPNFSAEERKRYKAEAVFMRNLSYFFMVRLYGDVPYYTEPFNQKQLGRMPMLTVLKNCIEDLEAVKNDLPWTYEESSKIGVRAMRGSAIALLMHMNMWIAGFEEQGNENMYYKATADLGKELIEDNMGSYQLLTLSTENTKAIFKGKTKESLFDIVQSVNYNEVFSTTASISDLLSHYPYRGTPTTTTSQAYYRKDFLDKIYFDAVPDRRKEVWFENMRDEKGTFQLLKFINVYNSGGQSVRNDDSRIVFRLADAILLTAEANAALTEDVEAQKYLNMVRLRAGAPDVKLTGRALQDEIFFERERELLGEGHLYFDLVRSKKILDPNYCLNPISVSDFNSGGWTWPIDESALTNSPSITLNQFWR